MHWRQTAEEPLHKSYKNEETLAKVLKLNQVSQPVICHVPLKVLPSFQENCRAGFRSPVPARGNNFSSPELNKGVFQFALTLGETDEEIA